MTWVTQGRSWYRSKAVIAAVTWSQGASGRKAVSTACLRTASGKGAPCAGQACACAKTTRGSSISRGGRALGVSAASPSATLGWACSGVERDAYAVGETARRSSRLSHTLKRHPHNCHHGCWCWEKRDIIPPPPEMGGVAVAKMRQLPVTARGEVAPPRACWA